MPRSSSSFTNDASLKRGGGSVKCCSASRAFSVELLAFGQHRQLVLERLVFFVLAVFRLLVNLEEAFELEHRTGNAEAVNVIAALGVDVHRGLVEDGRVHLRGHKALPDELVDLEFVFLQILLDLVGMAKRRTGTNGLVRVLGVFLRLVGVRRFGQELRAVSAARSARGLRSARRWRRGSSRYACR